ncbi:hypothetical protein Poli38472_007892 [Pythium oligandrum]|uniref:Uncharacterized protein n=1 Tax=Pythium oligandrum TaxID=41045 RepID=A0A8K1FLG5_PYTOL|nr:hypothetical protein Poli38472_007892 [Pythium oligandrum]|eukprot:TMW68220.1 hypothetical protein Poli38472_007892 [Pythium oligandrum]
MTRAHDTKRQETTSRKRMGLRRVGVLAAVAVALLLSPSVARADDGPGPGDAANAEALDTTAPVATPDVVVEEPKEPVAPVDSPTDSSVDPEVTTAAPPPDTNPDPTPGADDNVPTNAPEPVTPSATPTEEPEPEDPIDFDDEEPTTTPTTTQVPDLPSTPTTKPSLPSDPDTMGTPVTQNAAVLKNLRSSPIGVNPAIFVGFAVLCIFFLALWSRRRRGNEGGSTVMSGMATTTSTESSSGAAEPGAVKSKVQYSRIENRPEEPFDDDDAEFGGERDQWDDWEPDNQHTDDAVNRGTARLTKGFSSSSSTPVLPRPHTLSPPRSTGGTARASIPQLSPPPSSKASNDHLKDILLTESPAKSTSMASNSSNDSFEVVPPLPAVDLLSSSPSPPKPAAVVERSPEDDLFSQFGMVPTFKHGVQQPPVPVSRSTLTSTAFSSPSTTTAATTAGTTAAAAGLSASALFAADLDEIASSAAVDVSDEWGEDDDWVQGI